MQIEAIVFQDFGRTTSDGYRTKIRTFHLRLKGTQNPQLRKDLVSGELEPEQFCGMTDAVIFPFSLSLLIARLMERWIGHEIGGRIKERKGIKG